MLITYRRSGGLFTLLTFTAVTLVATVMTVAVAAGVLIVALGIAAVALLARAVLPRSWRHDSLPSLLSPWPNRPMEALLGFALPQPACTEPEWWTGAALRTDRHSDAWTMARRTATPNLAAKTVAFERLP